LNSHEFGNDSRFWTTFDICRGHYSPPPFIDPSLSVPPLESNPVHYFFDVELDDKRINKRYVTMVQSHLVHNQHTAAGVCPPSGIASSFAATQAAWRFLNNSKVTPDKLIQPIHTFALEQLIATHFPELPGAGFSLLVTDWSKIDYKNHTTKKDTVQLTHQAMALSIIFFYFFA
jgi:hypothetical protein